MTQQSTVSIAAFNGKQASEGPPQAERPSRLHLVVMSSGVAAGRTWQVQGNAHAQSWTLFATREQLDTFLTADPLRFDDPIRFTQLRKEFAHVFDRNTSNDHP